MPGSLEDAESEAQARDLARMTTPKPDNLKALDVLAEDIRGQRHRLERLIGQFRQTIEQVGRASDPGSCMKSGSYWRLVAFVDSLVRIRLFLEQNFNYVETVGVLAVARYLFEVTVWLKLLLADSRYGLIYYAELLKKQLDFYTELRNNAEREISFLRHTAAQEQRLSEKRLSEALQILDGEARNEALRRLNNEVTEEVDQAAARKFSLYAEQAQTNGYEFQAYLVETRVLLEHSKAIADLKEKMGAFERDTPSEINSLLPSRWKWKAQAERVDMKDEYEFIYAYASRLLHATPASLTTSQKNLEPDEMRVFLKYIRVRVLDAAEMAEELLARS
jgi:hypothetical protein